MTREEKLAAAGEYVLGTLDDAARVAFEAELTSDAELAAMVRRLEGSLAALDDTVQPEAVPDGMWAAVSARLGEQSAARVSVAPRAAARGGWMAIAASIVLALGLGFAAGSLIRSTPEPVVIAVLVDEGSTLPGAIVEAFADNSVHIVPLEAFAVPEGRILQVWTLPDPATGPVSLGTFADPQEIRFASASLPTPQPGQLYEITLEPSPGSPTGRPTGPILAKGLARAPL